MAGIGFDVYQNVTDRIVAAIEAGAKGSDWRMPWHAKAGGGELLSVPLNVTTGKAYRGVNIPLLWGASLAAGYNSNVWGTYKAFQAKGGQVRKGERSTMIVFWKKLDNDKKKNDDSDDTASGKKSFTRMMCRGFNVFNSEQVDGYTGRTIPARAKPLDESGRIAEVDRYFESIPATVVHGGNEAFFHRVGDYIRLPDFDQFTSPATYYSTRMHESGHWSGHKSRLDRDWEARCGGSREAYAAEELCAELCAAFGCAILGLANDPRADHAQYMAHWLGVLRADPRLIFSIASKAQKAVDYLNEFAAKAGAMPGDEPGDESDDEPGDDLALAA